MTPTKRRSSRRSGKASLAGSLAVLALFILIYLFQSFIEQDRAPATVADHRPPGGDTAWYSLYFSDPNGLGAEELSGGPDEALAAAIGEARLSVDLAVYQINLWSIRDALLAAH
jgi:hypothetical protein